MRTLIPFVKRYFISLYGTLSIHAFILYGYLIFSHHTIIFSHVLWFILILIAVMKYSLISHKVIAYNKKLISFVWGISLLICFNELFNFGIISNSDLNIICMLYEVSAFYSSFILSAPLKETGKAILKERSRLYPNYNYIELVDVFMDVSDYSKMLLHYDMFKISKDGIIINNNQLVSVISFQSYLAESGKKYDSLNKEDIDVISMINL